MSAFASATSTLRDGAFYLPADELTLPGYHPFDLKGQSLVFEPRGQGYAMRRESAPPPFAGPEVHDFSQTQSDPAWFIPYDLPFAFPIFGRTVTRVYVTKFNEVRFDVPVSESNAVQFGAAETAAMPEATVSPLMLTTS
ncbi:MAG TPA: hypothetical protein VF608_02470, partial [Thermoanaerobaculia bacterium]